MLMLELQSGGSCYDTIRKVCLISANGDVIFVTIVYYDIYEVRETAPLGS